MTDPVVQVTVEQTPVGVVIDSGTPEVTITDLLNPIDITIVSANPITVSVADKEPIINVNLGIGGFMDKDIFADMMEDIIDIDYMAPELKADLLLLRDLWGRVGNNVLDVMTSLDVDNIVETSTTYTDSQIQSTATAITTLADGVLANQSQITQTAEEVNTRVTALDFKNTMEFEAKDARLDINAEAIALTVSDLISTNSIVTQQSANLTIASNRITQEVIDRKALVNGTISSNTSRITQTAEALTTNITATNSLTGRMDSTEDRVTATEVITTVLSQSLVDSVYSIKAIESMTANRYGVVIEEDVGGSTYVAGFEMLVYPEWIASTADFTSTYATEDVIAYSDDKVYECLVAHEASAVNSPGSTNASTYWVELTEGKKSEFNVRADMFNVITPDGVTPLFSVDGVTGEVTITDALVVKSMESLDFAEGDPTKSWFSLDPTTGLAQFNNIKMTFSSTEDITDLQTTLGIDSSNQLLTWSGVRAIYTNATVTTADEWTFDSTYAGGAMIEIEVDDDFAGTLHAAFNEELITIDSFGDQDFGDVTVVTSTGFSDESVIESYSDLSIGDRTYDLGGFS